MHNNKCDEYPSTIHDFTLAILMYMVEVNLEGKQLMNNVIHYFHYLTVIFTQYASWINKVLIYFVVQ